MIQAQVISTFYKSTFRIIEGEFAGKATKISEIDFIDEEITSVSGKRFSFSILKPILKDIKGISLEEAEEIYRLYWNDPNRMYLEGIEEIKNNSGLDNTIYNVIRIWEGRDFVAGDRIEWGVVLEFCIDHSIDFFDLIKKQQAIKL